MTQKEEGRRESEIRVRVHPQKLSYSSERAAEREVVLIAVAEEGFLWPISEKISSSLVRVKIGFLGTKFAAI